MRTNFTTEITRSPKNLSEVPRKTRWLTWYFIVVPMNKDMREIFGVKLRRVAEDLDSWRIWTRHYFQSKVNTTFLKRKKIKMAIDIEVAETIQSLPVRKEKPSILFCLNCAAVGRVNPKNQKKRKGLDLGNSVIYSWAVKQTDNKRIRMLLIEFQYLDQEITKKEPPKSIGCWWWANARQCED